MNLSEELKDIIVAVGRNELEPQIAVDRMKKLKNDLHAVEGNNKTFTKAYFEAVKDVTFEEEFCKIPVSEMSDLGRGVEILDNIVVGTNWRERNMKQKEKGK